MAWLGIVWAGVPLLWACWANRRTSLAHALGWGIAAWTTWLAAAMTEGTTARYLALCFTACTGVAVLGARRPGAGAWHAVVGGLLAVLLMPLAESSGPTIDRLRIGFLGVVLAVVLMNYIPTRIGPGALLLVIACILELRTLDTEPTLGVTILLAIAPWVAWGSRAMGSRTAWDGDRWWRDFRDRFGVVWSQRLREQFNRAAEHANVPMTMTWSGPRRTDGGPPTESDRAASLPLLIALMKRFGLP